MGFMDKLKDAGKKAVFGAMLASVKKYGLVTGGKYKGCQVATDAQKEILLFVMIAKENGRHNIREDIESMTFESLNSENNSFNLTLAFKDGETCTITMSRDENLGSGLPTAAQRVAAQYSNIAEFLNILVHKVSFTAETRETINLVMRYTGNKEIS